MGTSTLLKRATPIGAEWGMRDLLSVRLAGGFLRAAVVIKLGSPLQILHGDVPCATCSTRRSRWRERLTALRKVFKDILLMLRSFLRCRKLLWKR